MSYCEEALLPRDAPHKSLVCRQSLGPLEGSEPGFARKEKTRMGEDVDFVWMSLGGSREPHWGDTAREPTSCTVGP